MTCASGNKPLQVFSLVALRLRLVLLLKSIVQNFLEYWQGLAIYEYERTAEFIRMRSRIAQMRTYVQ